jgi:hypothetical protein
MNLKYRSLFFLLTVIFVLNFGCKKNAVVEKPKDPPDIISFSANPGTISLGDSSTISWSVKNADSVTGSWGSNIGSNGSVVVSPKVDKTYTITAMNGNGLNTRSVRILIKKEGKIVLIESSLTYKYASWGDCRVYGRVKNIGNWACYNVKITLYALNKAGNVIDKAIGFPAGLAKIKPGERYNFDAVFWDLTNWNVVHGMEWETSWINSSGVKVTHEQRIFF